MNIKATGYNKRYKTSMRIVEEDDGKTYVESYAPINKKWLTIGKLAGNIENNQSVILNRYDMIIEVVKGE